MPSKVTCPECDAVLKLPKAPAPGKKVKCPKCGAGFTPEEDLEEVSVRPAKKRTVEPKPKKKEPPKEEPKPAAPKDDDDEGGTYAFIKEDEPEVEDEEEEDEDEDEDEEGEGKKKRKKPQIDYAPDLTVKDPRGPAQEKVMTASNLLMMNGVIGFVGWLGVLVIVLIPIIFPLRDDAETNAEGVKQGKGLGPALSGATGKPDPNPSSSDADKDKKKEKPEEPWTKVAGFDLALIASVGTLIFIAILIPFFLGMAYAAVIVIGGVKMQNLEGWGWGVAGSIMAMIPIHTFGLIVLSAVIIQLLIVMVLDDQDLANMLIMILMGLECLSGVGIGAYVLKVLLDPTVKAGFEYVAE